MSFSERAGLLPVLLLTGCGTPVVVTGPPSGSVVDSMLSRSAADISAMQFRLHQSGPSAQRPVAPSSIKVNKPLLTQRTSYLIPPGKTNASNAPPSSKGSGPASGFIRESGAAPTLREALNKIVPSGQTVEFAKGVSADVPELWRWTGNDRWPFVVDKMLAPHGLKARVDMKTNTVTVEPLQHTQAARVTTKSVSSPLPANAPVKPPLPGSAKQTTHAPAGRNPFRGEGAAKASPGVVVASSVPPVTVAPPVVIPARHWLITPGSTVKDWLYSQAAAESCTVPGIKNWTIDWKTPVNYRVDAPLVFDGDFHNMLNQLFTLYGTAKTPLYAARRPAQCVVSVDDKEVQ